MAHTQFSPDWLQEFADPYAVLGISLASDDKRILKQYRNVAKLLHPDRYVGADRGTQEFAGQLLARLVNPAYEQLKQEKNRVEVVAILRLQVKQMMQQGTLVPKTEVARQLMRQPVQSAEIFYEQQVTRLAETLYQSFEEFEPIIQQLRELNLVYMQFKLGDQSLREKRSGLIQPEVPTPPPTAPTPVTADDLPKSVMDTSARNLYATRHHDRAKQYIDKGAYDKAVLELKDALRMDAQQAEYHALLSYAYLCQDLPGMAKVYCQQALKLEPEHKLAQQLAKKLKLQPAATTATKATVTKATAAPAKRGLFGLFQR
jgi:tetratricopeptide (TPR) repeat protein